LRLDCRLCFNLLRNAQVASACSPGRQTAPIVRSKFNVALGIEAQGFCVLKSRDEAHEVSVIPR